MDVVCDLEVHAFLEVAAHPPVEVLFHVAVGDRRTLGQPRGPLHHLFLELAGREYGVDQTQLLGPIRREPLREVVQLLAFAGPTSLVKTQVPP